MATKKQPGGAPDHDTIMLHLRGWQEFQKNLHRLEDEELARAYLEAEKETYARAYVLTRLHGRLNLLRSRREKAELMAMSKVQRGTRRVFG